MPSNPEEIFAACDEVSKAMAARQLHVVRVDPRPRGVAFIHKLPSPQVLLWEDLAKFIYQQMPASKESEVYFFQGLIPFRGEKPKVGGCLEVFAGVLPPVLLQLAHLIQGAPRPRPRKVTEVYFPPTGFYAPSRRNGTGGAYEIRRDQAFSPQFDTPRPVGK